MAVNKAMEKIIKHFDGIEQQLKRGSFTKTDLKYIKDVLTVFLVSTDKTIEKANQIILEEPPLANPVGACPACGENGPHFCKGDLNAETKE